MNRAVYFDKFGNVGSSGQLLRWVAFSARYAYLARTPYKALIFAFSIYINLQDQISQLFFGDQIKYDLQEFYLLLLLNFLIAYKFLRDH